MNISGQEPDTFAIKEYENKMALLFDQMLKNADNNEKDAINSKIINLFTEALNVESSFEYSFNYLKHIGKVSSDDKKIRIYTWNVPYNDGTHRYCGFIQFRPSKNSKCVIYRLIDKSENIADPEKSSLTPENWYGALYYEIVTTKYKGETWYTLLGFDFNNIFSSKKIIDILYFDSYEKPFWGKPVFYYNNHLLKRVVFEFSARASMSLRYNRNKDMIIYDHLSPSRPSYEGKYQFYGPDFSYDGFEFKDGLWKEVKDLDVRNPMY